MASVAEPPSWAATQAFEQLHYRHVRCCTAALADHLPELMLWWCTRHRWRGNPTLRRIPRATRTVSEHQPRNRGSSTRYPRTSLVRSCAPMPRRSWVGDRGVGGHPARWAIKSLTPPVRWRRSAPLPSRYPGCGTDNEQLLADPFYLGQIANARRRSGIEIRQSLSKRFQRLSRAILLFETPGPANAEDPRHIRHGHCVFNDDM